MSQENKIKQINNPIVKYIKDSIEELKKVKWPSKKETLNHTVLVIVICLIMGLFLGLVDYGLTELLYGILNLVK